MVRHTQLVVAAATLTLVGCSSDGDDAAPLDDEGLSVPSVTVPSERRTPFCEAMIELADRLETDPPDDTGAVILETYLEILDEVPAEIENEFQAVIAQLQSGDATAVSSTAVGTGSVEVSSSPPATLEDFDAEGRLPGDSPAERVSDFVLFTCRDSDNNPGPPATEPLGEIVVDDTSG
jgi:hypothetical protein